MNITCLDIETTGLNKSIDRIIQLSLRNFDADTFELGEGANWYILPNRKTGEYIMDLNAVTVHGITRSFLKENGQSLVEIYPEWQRLTKDHIILSYNGTTFDIPMIQKDFSREGLDTGFDKCKFIDALDIERKLNKQDNNKLSETYERYFGYQFEGAHDASADILATIDVYKKQMESVEGKPNRSEIIAESILKSTNNLSISPDGFVYIDGSGYLKFRWGKHKNMPVVDVCKNDPGYIRWLWNKDIICNITKETIKKEFYKYRK